MSTRTTSARPASAMRWAVVAPTFPAPMTVTLLRAMPSPPRARSITPRAIGSPRGRRSASALAGRGHPDLAGVGNVDRAGLADPTAHAVGVRLEVRVEHVGDLLRGSIEGR